MNDTSLAESFTESFLARGDSPAITFLRDGRVETEISYFELERDACRGANRFRELGVEKGDRVILFIPKSLMFVVAHLALQKIGAIAVPLNPGFKQAEMEYLLGDAQARLILLEPEKEAFIRKIAPGIATLVIDCRKPYQEINIIRTAAEEFSPVEISPDDPGLIIYTSGTTGKPKGAVLTSRNLLHDARNIIAIWEIRNTDVLGHALPLFHVHGLCFALHTCLLAGAHILMLDQFSPATVIETLRRQDGPRVCSVFMAVPAMYAKLMAHIGERSFDFSHMRLWTSGSAPLLRQDFARIRKLFGKEPVEREGMSETGMNFSNPLHGEKKPGSIGIPLPALEVRLVDPATGGNVKPGQTGEIWLKGPAVTPGYWQKPGETAGAFEQGWFKTGDLGHVDSDGYYYLTDRIKHIIISGGENISPKEIESVINQVAGVTESSVVGVADQKWGEKIVAAVVRDPEAAVSVEAIQSHCKEHLHDWKCPKEIAFVRELPRNTMGKVLKKEVKKFF
ncbi:MAG: AMP-binding protein [Deltaproteobacteria bacterium]|jgi:malonyl-CoA/methylmalonyl-CoA synthetase|nr:AMP-binding protein [Deltaproteobacteria bacterium]